jgi:microsomal dipeptidase-like Zn-dependent dipeptidase
MDKQPKEFYDSIATGKSWEKTFVDREYPAIFPGGIRSGRDFPNVTKGLVERGYSKMDVEKVIG